ncbi:MAG: hypothetical protein VX185_09630 [Pseudomonadota bacterium]|nr:hypothetical protein [Pseudomonadota bacterium]
MKKIIFVANNVHHYKLFKLVKNKLYGNYFVDVLYTYKCKEKNSIIPENDVLISINEIRYAYFDREITYFRKRFGLSPKPKSEVFSDIIGYKNYFKKLLKEEKPDLIIGELCSGLPDLLLYEESCLLKIPFVSIRQSKVSNGIVFCNPLLDKPYVNDKKISELGFAVNYVNKIREKIIKPKYMVKTSKKFKFFDFSKVKTLYDYLTLYRELGTSNKKYFQYAFIMHIHRFFNKLKIIGNKNTFSDIPVNNSQKYLVYPLHYEPESSSSIRGYPFDDQLFLIEFIAKNLPSNYTLLVKEHLGNQGYRSYKDYLKIKTFFNVKLISPNTNVDQLFGLVSCVITINSRMGWEGLIKGLPVISLGRSFWDSLSFIYKIESYQGLSEALYSLDALVSDHKINEEELFKFICEYTSAEYKGNLVLKSDSIFSESNINALSTSIVDFVDNGVIG